MDINEVDTMQAIKNGNIAVFEKLFHTLYAPICGYVNKIINSKEVAEEIVQDLFFVLWKNRKAMNITTSLHSYLYKAAHNKAIHYIEHQKVKDKYINFFSNEKQNTESPEQAMEVCEMYALYKETLNKLPNQCKVIFILSRNQGLKYKEIAEKLSISVKTVEANMGKALKAFRHSFANY